MVDFTMQFPVGFIWGTATAAHQVEGGNTNNNWYEWENSGRVFQGQKSGLACDWWGGRYAEDFDRAAEMHNNAHRLSVEWSRIEPQPGQYDDAVLERYAQIVRALRERRLKPMVTLHHFSNPLWIEDQGGWANPQTVRHFEAFVRRVIDALGDQVTMWCTLNEPMVYATLSHLLGRFPPGGHNPVKTLRVVENLLRGHAAAFAMIKAVRPGAQVGLAKHQISLTTRFPRLVNGVALRTVRHFANQALVNALVTGTLKLPFHTVAVPEARDTLDWIGLDYYYRYAVNFHLLTPHQLFLQKSKPRGGIPGPGDVGEIWPEGLYEQIRWLYETTQKPIYITENGVPDPGDTLRPLHMVRSLRSVWQAINHNYPVKGYFCWTLVDNFEWSQGYDPRFRFGLYACDPETQQRTKRPSADLYGEICAANALTADMARRYLPEHADELFPGVDVQQEVKLAKK